MREKEMILMRFMAVIHRPSICWWPFPFLRPNEGEAFGRFRLFTCATLYPLYIWSFMSVILFLKKGMGTAELLPLMGVLFGIFLSYYSIVAYCWNRVHDPERQRASMDR
ncbi:hypothetical protein [Microbulbifer yueqingensis]|uniref:Uncharacterized protein n=1 Tax=Microbulbifer yueqingensis TaxID=658219 RepID=A0A1G9A6A0_9GAMM|nr:hypothetical protein [Microbulbifer yueqingensis]SDK22115.1 hypothetical protein SAMN05216212_1852 [Microbulbifer yueqingensis]